MDFALGLAHIARLGPAFWLRIPIGGLSSAHDLHRPWATKLVQGWPKLWTNFRALIGIFGQSVGSSCAIGANPVQFSLLRSAPLSATCFAFDLDLTLKAPGARQGC